MEWVSEWVSQLFSQSVTNVQAVRGASSFRNPFTTSLAEGSSTQTVT
jgi:hypothetical protein